jgi:DNA (cytosine-5)-methyltransferase 1
MTLITERKGEEKDVDSTQNIISFCTGYGGLELGIKRAGVDVRTVVNVEIEAFCCANLGAKIEEGLMDDAPIYTDLKTFPAEIFRGKIHGITCGYPCQPFSSAGKRKGEKDPRHLWPYIRRHIRAIGPSWVFAENVRGHTTMGLWRVLSDLEEDGYRTEFGLYSAEETGAPHQRIRCFILAKLPDTSGEGLQGDEFGGSCDEQVKGLQGTYEPTSELHQVRDGQLAHTASREPRQSQARNRGQDTSGGSEEELVNAVGRRFEQCESECEKKGFTSQGCQPTRWPARPGEEQYEWEEPRVTEAQSELGGAVDGLTCGMDPTANRVDRLRLLGNGVVSQTAELAWKSLWRKING